MKLLILFISTFAVVFANGQVKCCVNGHRITNCSDVPSKIWEIQLSWNNDSTYFDGEFQDINAGVNDTLCIVRSSIFIDQSLTDYLNKTYKPNAKDSLNKLFVHILVANDNFTNVYSNSFCKLYPKNRRKIKTTIKSGIKLLNRSLEGVDELTISSRQKLLSLYLLMFVEMISDRGKDDWKILFSNRDFYNILGPEDGEFILSLLSVLQDAGRINPGEGYVGSRKGC
jgi:hypothetical protein